MNQEVLFRKKTGIRTCWANMENPKGEKGKAGMSHKGRKGAPCLRPLSCGQTHVLAEAEGSGMVRHIWITFEQHLTPEALKGFKLECFWDGSDKPAVSVPVGDFFCCNLGRTSAFENIFFSNPEGRSFNCYLPMPFKTGMKITITNESNVTEPQFFYQVDYTLGDQFDDETLYFHAYYHREETTQFQKDYTILPLLKGSGRYLGASFGVIANPQMKGTWWGEGEVKCYLDGDTDYPTLCGTGTEDYIGTGWGQGEYAHLHQGCLIADETDSRYAFYRFHDVDPVMFEKEIRITIQHIGCSDANGIQKMKAQNIRVMHVGGEKEIDWETCSGALFERFEDDWCSVAYFYLDCPYSNLPALDSFENRVKKYGFIREYR